MSSVHGFKSTLTPREMLITNARRHSSKSLLRLVVSALKHQTNCFRVSQSSALHGLRQYREPAIASAKPKGRRVLSVLMRYGCSEAHRVPNLKRKSRLCKPTMGWNNLSSRRFHSRHVQARKQHRNPSTECLKLPRQRARLCEVQVRVQILIRGRERNRDNLCSN